jgi:hypothetical protein
MSELFWGEPKPLNDWVLLWGCAAFGGVRIYSQFAFLKETSATTLAMSNLAIQAITIILSILLFGTPLTAFLGLGVTFTIIMSAVYTGLKLTKARSIARKRLACPRLMTSWDRRGCFNTLTTCWYVSGARSQAAARADDRKHAVRPRDGHTE